MTETHNIPPVYDTNSKILILGSFPSVKSRKEAFFYGHRQNRFWKVLSVVLNEPLPQTVCEKKALLSSHGIALWDVIQSCDIQGSSDSSIKNVTPNDLEQILKLCPDIKIFVNGKTAEHYYNKYIYSKLNINAHTLPSTSPANAAWNLEKLISAWDCILNYI